MKPTTVSAAKFKAGCLGLLDRVARTKRSLLITKRGRPVARVVPLEEGRQGLKGSVLSETDLVAPTGARWDAE